MDFLLFLLLALLVGFVGSIVGSGGGFLLVPLLLFTTDLSPQVIAGTSLAVVFFGALSSTLAYRRQRKVDHALAKLFIIAMVPAAILGVYLNQHVEVGGFTVLFGLVMVLVSVSLLKNMSISVPHFIPNPVHARRRITDSSGKLHDYIISLRRSAVISFLTGLVAPVVGIGGGVLRVPPMIMVMGVPPKIAAATSQMVTLAASALAVALFASKSQVDLAFLPPLAIGVVAGSQGGAYVSNRIDREAVKMAMACAILFVGAWMLGKALL